MGSLDYTQEDSRLLELTQELRSSRGCGFRGTFYCPILHVKEETELCKGHVLPQAVGGRNWVVQRKDVDNFFGSFAEAGFSHGVKLRSMGFDDSIKYILDKRLSSRVNLSMTDSGGVERRVRPTQWTGDELTFVVHANGDDLCLKDPVSLSFAMDTRYETLLACVHSLHLGVFREGGYRYVVSPTGEFNAALLRNAYRKFATGQISRSPDEKTAILGEMCSTHVNMVRPIVGSTDSLDARLLSDPFRWFLACWDESTRELFATIHFLKAENEWNGVMSYNQLGWCARAMICSAVPISFKATMGHLADNQIHVGPLRESTPRFTWPCGETANSQVYCPIELAAQEIKEMPLPQI